MASEAPVLLLTRQFRPSDKDVAYVDVGVEETGTPSQHARLAKGILKKARSGKRPRPDDAEQRTHFAGKVSEFAFGAGKEASVRVDLRDLARPLLKGKPEDDESSEKTTSSEKPTKNNKKAAAIHGELRRLKARAPTRAPLAKHQEERLLRKVGYGVAVDEVKKWKGVVKRNRDAKSVSFPLVQPSFNFDSTQDLVKRFKPRTPLEMEVAKLLQGSESVLGSERVLTLREERALKAMDLEEAKRKRAELQKTRSLQSFAAARAKRQGKIKSKKYHRRLRKEKESENAKVYEELEKSHPERFQMLLEKMERKRVEERMNQRHKNNSKWVKSMMKLGKKDAEAKTALNEALEVNRKLTEKRPRDDDDDDVNDQEDTTPTEEADPTTLVNGDNPWLGGTKKRRRVNESETSDTIQSMYPKLEEIRHDLQNDDDDDDDDDELDENDPEEVPVVRDNDEDDDDDFTMAEVPSKSKKQKTTAGTRGDGSDSSARVDPHLILGGLEAPERVVGSTQLPTLASYEDEDRRLTIEEAFADDDVVAEFAAAKSTAVDAETPKAVCSALPGWGDWVGGKLDGVSKKRKRQFTVKPASTVRRDAGLPRVFFNEAALASSEAKMAAHRVSDLPFRDYKSVAEFEKTIRAPVGRTWNAEAAYQNAIVPGVATKMGTIIDPINKERTFVRKEEGEKDESETKKLNEGKKPKKNGKAKQ